MKKLMFVMVTGLALSVTAWAGTVDEDYVAFNTAYNTGEWAQAEILTTAFLARADAKIDMKFRAAQHLFYSLANQKKDTKPGSLIMIEVAGQRLAENPPPVEQLNVKFARLGHYEALGEWDKAKADRADCLELAAGLAESATAPDAKAGWLWFRISQHANLLSHATMEKDVDALLAIPEKSGRRVQAAYIKAERYLGNIGKSKEAVQLLLDNIDDATNYSSWMRSYRSVLNSLAVRLNKQILAASGVSFVGPGKLELAQALVDAENSGVGLAEALTNLGLTLPADFAGQLAAVKAESAEILAGTKEFRHEFAAKLEWYTGVKGAQDFEQRYNQGATP